MKIKSIRLKNYRQYNDHYYNFDNEFNVVLGENECGKTTLMSAIQFCLYGPKHVVDNKLLNQQFKDKNDFSTFATSNLGKNDVFVEVEFAFGNEELVFMSRNLEIDTSKQTTYAYTINEGKQTKLSFKRLLRRFPLFMSKIAIVDEKNISIISDLINTNKIDRNFIREVGKLSQNYQLEYYITVIKEALEQINNELAPKYVVNRNQKIEIGKYLADRDFWFEKRSKYDKEIKLLKSKIESRYIQNEISTLEKELEELESKLLENKNLKCVFVNSKIKELNSRFSNSLLKVYFKDSDTIESTIINNNREILSYFNISSEQVSTNISDSSYPVRGLIDEKFPSIEVGESNIYYKEDEELEKKLEDVMLKLEDYRNSTSISKKISNLEVKRDEAVLELDRCNNYLKKADSHGNNNDIMEQIQELLKVQKKLSDAHSKLVELLNGNTNSLIKYMNENINRNVKTILGDNCNILISENYDISYNRGGVDGTSGGVDIAISISYLLGLLESAATIITDFEDVLKVQNLTYPIVLDGAFSKVDEGNSDKITQLLKNSNPKLYYFLIAVTSKKLRNIFQRKVKLLS